VVLREDESPGLTLVDWLAFGKNYVVNGGDPRSLQEIMGHSNISTTEIYTNLSQRDLIAEHHQFTPLRSVHAPAQGSLFTPWAVKEADEILAEAREKP
jgi:hypothetical protein